MVNSFNGIVLSNEKEWAFDAQKNMNESQNNHAG